MNRRGFLGGLVAAFAAPAIVHAGVLMPVKPSLLPRWRPFQIGIDGNFSDPVEELIRKIDEYASRRPNLLEAPLWETLPVPRGCSEGFYYEMTRVLPWFDGAKDRHMVRVDRMFRDYSEA